VSWSPASRGACGSPTCIGVKSSTAGSTPQIVVSSSPSSEDSGQGPSHTKGVNCDGRDPTRDSSNADRYTKLFGFVGNEIFHLLP